MKIVIILGLLSLGMGEAPVDNTCYAHLSELSATGSTDSCILGVRNISRGYNEWYFSTPYGDVPVCVCTVEAGPGASRVCQISQASRESFRTFASIEGDGSPELLSIICKGKPQ